MGFVRVCRWEKVATDIAVSLAGKFGQDARFFSTIAELKSVSARLVLDDTSLPDQPKDRECSAWLETANTETTQKNNGDNSNTKRKTVEQLKKE